MDRQNKSGSFPFRIRRNAPPNAPIGGKPSTSKATAVAPRRSLGLKILTRKPPLKLWIANEDPSSSSESGEETEEQVGVFMECIHAIEDIAEDRTEGRIGRISMAIHNMSAGGQHMFFEAPINVSFDRHGIRRFLTRSIEGTGPTLYRDETKIRTCSTSSHRKRSRYTPAVVSYTPG